MNQQRTNLLVSKPHFPVLDGLRGIAALSIVVFHFMEWIYTDPAKNFIGHGFLAVDFFFCLSGFVIGYAYDDRIRDTGLKQFFLSRLIRLHPLVLLGSVLGLLGLLFDPFSGPEEVYATGRIVWIFVCSILLVPFPVMESRAFNLFGLNAPSWSLFWEYVANIVYALILHRLKRGVLVVLAILAGVWLCSVSIHAGNLLGGWAKNNFWDGGARIAYSFLAGLIIYRYSWIIRNRLGFAGLALLLLVAFIVPHTEWNWLTELVIVMLFFPLMVSLGAGTLLSNAQNKFCTFSGNISYPLYMTHYFGLWIFGHYFYNVKPAAEQLPVVVIGGTVILVGLAYAAMVLYDIPVRAYLNRKRIKTSPAN